MSDGLKRPGAEPWAYLLTFACYGERLHGDQRGSVDPNHNGFLTAYIFLADNGLELTASEASAAQAVLVVASGDLGEGEFASWLRDNCELQP